MAFKLEQSVCCLYVIYELQGRQLIKFGILIKSNYIDKFSLAIDMDNTFVREIEVYENERYMPLSGWSSKGLMITDRSAYSTEDGSANFSNLDEASIQLTSEG